MSFKDWFLCPACSSVYRPVLDEEICNQCEQAEARSLEEISLEEDADFAERCAK